MVQRNPEDFLLLNNNSYIFFAGIFFFCIPFTRIRVFPLSFHILSFFFLLILTTNNDDDMTTKKNNKRRSNIMLELLLSLIRRQKKKNEIIFKIYSKRTKNKFRKDKKSLIFFLACVLLMNYGNENFSVALGFYR